MSVPLDQKIRTVSGFIDALGKYSSGTTGKFTHRMVTTNGCFDILTAGHVRCLEQAALLGSFLVVLVNTDASVARYKGKDRPYVPLEQRMMVLAGLQSVRDVIPFDEDTPTEVLERLYLAGVGPTVHVKGGDYVIPEILPPEIFQPASLSDKLQPAIDDTMIEHYKAFPEARIVHKYGGRIETIPFEIDVSTSEIVERIRNDKVFSAQTGELDNCLRKGYPRE